MNFPVGLVVSKGQLPNDFSALAGQLNSKRFSGYVIQSVKSHYIEEGTLFFREGEAVACVAECLALGRTVKGKEAFDFFLNQTKGMGFFQAVELTRSQVDLVTAFDEKLLLGDKINLKDLPKLIPIAFSGKFEPEARGADLLESYGLGELGKN